MRTLFVCFLLGLAATALAQDCGQEFRDLGACLVRDIERIMAASGIDPDQLHGDVRLCLATAGCNDPEKVQEDRMYEMMAERINKAIAAKGIPFRVNAATVKATHECSRLVVKPRVEACVKENQHMSTFTLPDFDAESGGDGDEKSGALRKAMSMLGGKGGHGGRGGPHMLKRLIESIYNTDVCPTAAASSTARSCIEAAAGRTFSSCENPISIGFLMYDKKQEMCAAKDVCEAKMSPECVRARRDLPDMLCECAEEIKEDDLNAVLGQTSTCVQQRTGRPLPIPPGAANSPEACEMAEKLMGKLCGGDRHGGFDPCTDDPEEFFGRHFGGKGGHGGGHRGGRHGGGGRSGGCRSGSGGSGGSGASGGGGGNQGVAGGGTDDEYEGCPIGANAGPLRPRLCAMWAARNGNSG